MSRQSHGVPRVLVLCTHNASRSQMAEALIRSHARGSVSVSSAGTEPGSVNPFAVQVMHEIGIDISGARSKHVSEFLDQEFDYVLTVCDDANETCPIFPGPVQRIHWSFPDPSAATGDDDERLAVFRKVRDAINSRLVEWIPDVVKGVAAVPTTTDAVHPLRVNDEEEL